MSKLHSHWYDNPSQRPILWYKTDIWSQYIIKFSIYFRSCVSCLEWEPWDNNGLSPDFRPFEMWSLIHCGSTPTACPVLWILYEEPRHCGNPGTSSNQEILHFTFHFILFRLLFCIQFRRLQGPSRNIRTCSLKNLESYLNDKLRYSDERSRDLSFPIFCDNWHKLEQQLGEPGRSPNV